MLPLKVTCVRLIKEVKNLVCHLNILFCIICLGCEIFKKNIEKVVIFDKFHNSTQKMWSSKAGIF
jgi:hypothetical protein